MHGLLNSKSAGKILNVKAQRQVFEELAKSKGLDPLVADTWYKIPYDSISRIKVIRPILHAYKQQYGPALQRLFPELTLDLHKIKAINSNSIVLPQNEQQRLIRNLGSKLGYNSLEDYYKLSSLDFRNNGLRFIVSAFPDHTWNEWLFEYAPSQLWAEWLKDKLSIETMEDWYKVNTKDFYQNRGKSLLANCYHDSVASIIQATYPQHPWMPWLFDDGVNSDFWKSSDNQKHDVISGMFSKMDDWYNITRKNFTENFGKPLLDLLGTPDEVVKAVYKTHEWTSSMFKVYQAQHKVDLSGQGEVQRVLRAVEARVGLQIMEEWYVVSTADLFAVQNGRRLYNEYDRSMLKILQTAYPDHQWDETKFQRNSKNKRQLLLEKMANDLFEGHTILSNARKSTQLKFDSANQPYMELDLYIPDLKLAIEYQDPHHYSHVWYTNKPLETYQQRDELKMQAAVNQGITLIHIPFWWDGTKESLIGTIREKRSDVLVQFADASYPPISSQMPDQALDFVMKDYFVPGLGVPMLATPLLTLNDFSANEWWMLEKYDGIRAFWSPDEKHFLSRSGKKLSVDPAIQELFSKFDFWMDGEIWFGAGAFDEAGKVAHKAAQINWDKFHYVVFDAPKCEGSYAERYSFLQQRLPKHERIIIPKYEQCTSTENMLQRTQEIIDEGGEGIIIRNPKSLYKQGRSSEFLKLKKYRDAEARIKSKKTDDKWECEMPNGVVFTAPVEASLKNKSSTLIDGAIVSFKHRGYANNGMPKLATIYRVRNDIGWEDLKTNSIKPSSYKEYAPHLNKAVDRKPLGYWNDKNNVKNWFEEFARSKNLDPQQPETWKKISLVELREAKGSSSIGWKYGSMHKALQDVFPGAVLSRY